MKMTQSLQAAVQICPLENSLSTSIHAFNLAVILLQLCYGTISFITLVSGCYLCLPAPTPPRVAQINIFFPIALMPLEGFCVPNPSVPHFSFNFRQSFPSSQVVVWPTLELLTTYLESNGAYQNQEVVWPTLKPVTRYLQSKGAYLNQVYCTYVTKVSTFVMLRCI